MTVISNHTPKLNPFLKWAGGKRWLAEDILKNLPAISGRYIEPFLGGGAIFFALSPPRSLLSDANGELINAYKCIKNDHSKVTELLQLHQTNHSVDYYYKIRSLNLNTEFERAARFIYLNRTCWNGLYRVNLKGQFNVPIGTKTTVLMPSDKWDELAIVLRNAELKCSDFEASIDIACEGDLIFADPPYTIKHNYNGFIKYNESIFSWTDQIRLRDSLLRAKKRGVRIISTNANHESVRALYSNDFCLTPIERKSVLSASAEFRGIYEELLICSDNMSFIRT